MMEAEQTGCLERVHGGGNVTSATLPTISTAVGSVWLEPDGILCGDSVDGATLTLEDMQVIAAATRQLVGDARVVTMVDISGVRSITREARCSLGSPARAVRTKALALVVRSPVSRVIGNVFIGLSRPAYPVRLFSERSRARTWLRTFLEDDNAAG